MAQSPILCPTANGHTLGAKEISALLASAEPRRPSGLAKDRGGRELLSNLVYAEEIKRRPGWVVRSLLR